MITITANARDATYVSDDLITSGSVGIPAKFLLSDDFDGLSNIAVFQGSGVSIDVTLTASGQCVVPHEVVATAGGYLRIGVYGRNAEGTIVIPTVWAMERMILQGTVPSGVDPSEPTPDWTAQVQQMATEALANSEDAVQIATEARDGAAGSAAAAAASAEQAAASATQAGQSETNAASSAASASADAAAAAEARADAQTDAAAASESADNARDAAQAAEESASAAAGAAAAAAASEGNAAGSASAAAQSASAAAASATAAAASEAAAREAAAASRADYTELAGEVSDLSDEVADKYEKPAGGIPASDLAAGVVPEVPVQDVQVNGTSVLSGGVANIPEASANAYGVVRTGTVTVTGSTPTITALPGIRYVCGECVTLDITLPASGIVDVVFKSGATPTVLTITPTTGQTVRWANGFDPTSLEANTTYEINIADGLGVAGSWS